MSSTLVRDLIDAGIHFGHPVSRWNPKMGPYILGRRNGIHIVNIKETLRGLLRAQRFLSRVVASGKDVLFVGTKRQARASIEEHAKRIGMHFVSQRWLGGTLTNFRTIRSRLARLVELEAEFQNGQFAGYSKKRQASLTRERNRIQRNLEGIRNMERLPGVLVVIDVQREHIAVKEARKLGIPTVCLIDTDSDPEYADIPIPGNDDAIRSIDLIVRALADAALEGLKGRPTQADTEAAQSGSPQRPARGRARQAYSRADSHRPEPAPTESRQPEDATEGPAETSPGPGAADLDDQRAAARAAAESSSISPSGDRDVAG